MRKAIALLLACLLLLGAALAEDVYIIDDVEEATLISFTSSLSVSSSYLRIDAPRLQGRITVIITDLDGNLVYQQDYGYCEAFCSDDIYLPLQGERTEYTVDLLVNTALYSFFVERSPAEDDGLGNFWEDPTQAPQITEEPLWVPELPEEFPEQPTVEEPVTAPAELPDDEDVTEILPVTEEDEWPADWGDDDDWDQWAVEQDG